MREARSPHKNTRSDRRKPGMHRRTICVSLIALLGTSLLLGACGKGPDTEPVGPVGPQGSVGPQALEGTPPANLTVIEDTDIMVTKQHPFSGFTRVEVSDGFDVTIRQSEGFRVSTQLEETAVPYVEMDQEGDTLRIQLKDGRAYHMVNITLDVEITMPELTGLVLEDGSDVTVAGFGEGFEAEVDFLSKLHRE